MRTNYTDKITKTPLDGDKIIYDGTDGVVVTNKNCWKYVPKENLQADLEFDDQYYFNRENRPQPLAVKNTSSAYTEKTEYYFGIKNLQLKNIIASEKCGLLSEYIGLGSYSYISLTAEIEAEKENTENTVYYGIEYSIIDGSNEIPILPNKDQDMVTAEKLFYNLPTRFLVNDLLTAPILYEDGIAVDKNYLMLTADDYEKHTYALTYQAGGDPGVCIPENENIKLKIILRSYTNNGEDFPVRIKSVIINKFGGSAEWN